MARVNDSGINELECFFFAIFIEILSLNIL